MRLCIVTHCVIKDDGQGRVNYEIVWEAIRRDYEVTILANSISPDLQQNPKITWVVIANKHLPTALLREIVFSWKSAAWLRQHRNEFDLVMVNGAITSAASDVNAAHFIHSSWMKSPVHTFRQRRNHQGLYQWFYTHLNSFWEKQAFHRTKAIIAVSQRVKQELLDIGVAEQNIRVITNGVDLQEFYPSSADPSELQQANRDRWQLPNQVPMALFVGDIRSNRKNLDTVLQALVEVADLHLAIAGTLAGSSYPAMAQKLGLDHRVHFLDRCYDLPDLMRVVDFFVFPSRYEPFGMAVLEAMASGLPIIVSADAGVAEIVSPDCGEILSDPEDKVTLSQTLRKLTEDPDSRQKMGQAGRSIAQQQSWQSKASQYLNLFEELSHS